MGYIYIFFTIMFTVYGQLILKQQVNTVTNMPSGFDLIPFYFKFILTRPLVMSAFISAVLASVAWMGAISRFELSYAYPFMILSFFVVVLLSIFLFQEVFNWYKIIGLIVISLGIVIVCKGS